MTRWIDVVEPGFLTTVQDLGRFGLAHLGVSAGGAADPLSLRAGNRLAGNPDTAAALEMTLLGGTFRFAEETHFALTGAGCDARLDGVPVPAWTAAPARAGAQLACGRTRHGARAYLCVAGGFLVKPVLGSASTDLRSGFGGLHGRTLRRGDRIRIGTPDRAPLEVDARPLRYDISGGSLRVTPGPELDRFPADAMDRLCRHAYTVRDDSNRLGIRLAGEPIEASNRDQLLTEGVSLGALQIPPDGQPILLFVDQQTTGGYPKLANVILADLPRAGQLAPHASVRFIEVDIATAHSALRVQELRLRTLLGEAH